MTLRSELYGRHKLWPISHTTMGAFLGESAGDEKVALRFFAGAFANLFLSVQRGIFTIITIVIPNIHIVSTGEIDHRPSLPTNSPRVSQKTPKQHHTINPLIQFLPRIEAPSASCMQCIEADTSQPLLVFQIDYAAPRGKYGSHRHNLQGQMLIH